MPLPSTPTDFFAQLLAGGALYGVVVTWLLDGLLALWAGHAGAPVSGTKRRWLSIAVALLVPLGAYGGLCALGAAVLSADGLYSALLVGIAATAGKQVVYAGRESLAKPTGVPYSAPLTVPLGEDPAYRAAYDASGDPDQSNGGHSLHAPSTAPAPPAGDGPSLAETLAAEYGVPPEPEDSL